MGIRIHKCLGYGLADLECKDSRLIDKRINLDSPLLDWDDTALDWQKYLDWLETRDRIQAEEEALPGNFLDKMALNRVKAGKEDIRKMMFSDAFSYATEYGIPNVLVIRPLSCKNWSRYDDPIDYCEESWLRNQDISYPQINKVETLPHPIFPFSCYMDDRTGERINVTGMDIHVVKEWQKQEVETNDLEAQALGFQDLDQALNHCVPEVPAEIQDICEFSKLFKDPDAWKQMRPLLYIYWG